MKIDEVKKNSGLIVIHFYKSNGRFSAVKNNYSSLEEFIEEGPIKTGRGSPNFQEINFNKAYNYNQVYKLAEDMVKSEIEWNEWKKDYGLVENVKHVLDLFGTLVKQIPHATCVIQLEQLMSGESLFVIYDKSEDISPHMFQKIMRQKLGL